MLSVCLPFTLTMYLFVLLIADESEVVGMCGLHMDYEREESRESQRKRYPWWAFVTVQVNN